MDPISLLVGGVLLAVGFVAGRLGRRRPPPPADDPALRLRPRAEPARPGDLHLLRRAPPRHLRPARAAGPGTAGCPAPAGSTSARGRSTRSSPRGCCRPPSTEPVPDGSARAPGAGILASVTARPAPRSPRRRVVLAATEPARTLVSAGAPGRAACRCSPGRRAASRTRSWCCPGCWRRTSRPGCCAPGSAGSATPSSAGRWAATAARPRRWSSELPLLVDRLAGEHGTSVSIVGWSLGGIYARRLARRAPRQVRQVISLGSPFARPSGAPTPAPAAGSTGTWRRSRRTRIRASRTPLARPLPVPSTAVYSKWDGVVDWRACRQQPGPPQRERRGAQQPPRHGARPRRALDRRRPAGPAAARLAAVRAADPVRARHPLPARGLTGGQPPRRRGRPAPGPAPRPGPRPSERASADSWAWTSASSRESRTLPGSDRWTTTFRPSSGSGSR